MIMAILDWNVNNFYGRIVQKVVLLTCIYIIIFHFSVIRLSCFIGQMDHVKKNSKLLHSEGNPTNC